MIPVGDVIDWALGWTLAIILVEYKVVKSVGLQHVFPRNKGYWAVPLSGNKPS